MIRTTFINLIIENVNLKKIIFSSGTSGMPHIQVIIWTDVYSNLV